MTYTPSSGGGMEPEFSIDPDLIVDPVPAEEPKQAPTGEASAPQAEPTAAPSSTAPEQPTGTEDKPTESKDSGFLSGISDFDINANNEAVKRDLGIAFAGTTDTIIDLAQGGFNLASNAVLRGQGPQIDLQKYKLPKYDNEAEQAAREIVGFIAPELALAGSAKRLSKVAHSRVGWSIGNNAYVKRLGEAGIDVGTGTAISAAKTETSDPGNIFDLFRKLPGNWDWIANNLGSSHLQDPDMIRQQNLQADGILMGIPSLISNLGILFRHAQGAPPLSVSTADVVVDGMEITGNTAKSKAALAELDPAVQYKDKAAADIWNARDGELSWDELQPNTRQGMLEFYESQGLIPPRAGTGEEFLVDWALDQDSALDELGRYNLKLLGDSAQDVPLKGVNDLYEFNEIGMRTPDDFGIFGASIDQARIANNAGTSMGRIRNMISPAAMKYVGKNLNAVDDINLGFAKSLEDIDDAFVKGDGWSLTMDDILKAGDDLVIDFFDPSLDINGIRRMFGNSIKVLDDGTEVLSPSAYGDVFNQVVKMGQEFNSMDIAKAQAYVGTSLAGQISDAAEMARLRIDSRVGVKAAQERILDNMKYLMRLKGSSNFYRNYKNSMANMFDPVEAVTRQTPAELRSTYRSSMESLNSEINQFTDQLQYSFEKYPELGEAIMELYELTDGRVYSIETINDTLKKSFGWSNPFKAQDPKTPNLIGQATRANWFNSMLSAAATPVRAFIGNIAGNIDEPVSYFAGALMRQDMDSVKKGFYAYRAVSDVRTKAFPLMRDLFRKASQNNTGIELATDLDYSIKIDNKLNAMRKLAAAEADRGNSGTQFLINEYIALQEIAQHPAMKFSSNTMTGMDGLPQSMMANAEARFRAIEKGAREGITDAEGLRKIANEEYDSMFDASGTLLEDKVAKYNADRIALRLNTPLAQGLNELTQKMPWTKLFFPFPGTQANILNIVDETIPLPFRSFQQDINELAYRSVESFSENPALMREVLERKGYDVNTMLPEDQLTEIVKLKNKTLGRKGITTALVGGFTTLYFNGRVTGEGYFNKEAQAAREKTAQIPKNSIMGPDGRWYSYMELLGPGYGRWVSTVVTALENINYLGSGNTEDIMKKLAMVFGGVLEEDSGLSALVPLVEMAQGNAYAMTRWGAGMLNSMGPLSGLRNEIGNLLNGGLRIIDNDLKAMVANRNKALGVIFPEADLPKLTNPLDGTVPNEYNPIMRLYNQYSPIKMTAKASENSLFLGDIGYSYTTMFKTYKGVDLLPEEREALFKLVADDGQFKRDVTRIRKHAEKIGFIDNLRTAKANGATGEELEEYLGIHGQIRDAAKLAEEMALTRLDAKFLQAINTRMREAEVKRSRARIGAQSFIEQTPTR